MAIHANIRRIKIDPTDDYSSLSNANTGGLIYLPRGRDIALQFALYEKGIFIDNPTHLGTITAEVKPYNDRNGTALVTANTNTIAQISEGQWADNTSQHFTITLPAAQTISLATANETDYWLVVTALTTPSGKPLTLVSGRCVGVSDGGNHNASVPVPGDPTYVTAAQFFSTIGNLNNLTIEENGYRMRLGIDENGQLVLRQA